jgi:hypothetical protein
MADYIYCHEECASLPANPQCVYRLSAEDAVGLARDLDDAKAQVTALKAEVAYWNRAWHEQREATGRSYWNGYHSGWARAMQAIRSIMKPYS